MSEEWLDDVVTADTTRVRRWRKRAQGNPAWHDGIMAIPTMVNVQYRIPIDAFRIYKAWCNQRGVSTYGFARQALLDALASHDDFPRDALARMRQVR